ncbi:MAG: hypothetical protein KC457_09570 [Myxococcales bacterium]|nr:hypothetical protein [Myxococcales bacterium]
MSPRFEHDAGDAETTLHYFRGRAMQMLHDDRDWGWSGLVTPLCHQGVEWGSETLLHELREGRPCGPALVSVYVYAGHRGRGHLRRHAGARPAGQRYLTTPGCGIFEVLVHLDPATVMAAPISGWPEYRAIEDHYGAGVARRSGVPLMNHVDEGLRVLHRWLGASPAALRAYCLHPLVQGDADLRASYDAGLLDGLDPTAVALALEYRHIANGFLSPMESHPGYEDPASIVRSPLAAVDRMLVADKLQNCKDFRRHHRDSHPRASWLERYFTRWLEALGVGLDEVDRLDAEVTVPEGRLGPPRDC